MSLVVKCQLQVRDDIRESRIGCSCIKTCPMGWTKDDPLKDISALERSVGGRKVSIVNGLRYSVLARKENERLLSCGVVGGEDGIGWKGSPERLISEDKLYRKPLTMQVSGAKCRLQEAEMIYVSHVYAALA